MASPEAVKLFEKYKVLSGIELHSRYEIYLEQYAKNINIEALASIQMVKKTVSAAVIKYSGILAQTIHRLKMVTASASVHKKLLK